MKLLHISLIALTGELVFVGNLALARPTTCWFQQTTGAASSPASSCDVQRVGCGYTISSYCEYRLKTDGITRTISLYEDNYAEVVVSGKRYKARWKNDNDGDTVLTFSDGSWFAFKLPYP